MAIEPETYVGENGAERTMIDHCRTEFQTPPMAGPLHAAVHARCRQEIRFLARLLGFRLDAIHRRMLAGHCRERDVLLAPRGFGKTTIRTVLKTLHSVLRNPDIRILLVSRSETQAAGFLRQIAAYLAHDATLAALFGPVRGVPWTRTELCLRNRTTTAKEATVTALGVGGPVISKHYDLIICDDIVDEASAASARLRAAARQWFFTTLLPCLEPHGAIHVLGTRYHPQDLYGALLAGAFAQHHTVLAALDARDQSTWPEHFPTAHLHQLRREAGPIIFDAQYQNSTVRMVGRMFRTEMFRFGAPPGDLPLQHYQGVDLAISRSERADWFTVVTVGICPAGDVYIRDAYRGRHSFQEQTRIIANLAARWDPVRVGIESNAYQAAQLEHVWATTTVPAVGVHTIRDKVTRGWKLSARFERGDVIISPDAVWLADELRDFPDGEHDDGFDALDHALTVAAGRGPNIRVL